VVAFMRVVGVFLVEVSPKGVTAIMERLRTILQEGMVDKRVQYQIQTLLIQRKNHFADFPSIPEELDLVERDDQITFELSLDDETLQKQELLDVFCVDPDYDENEKGLGGDS